MEKDRLLYLSREDVAATGIGMPEMIEALGAALKEKGEGKTEMPPKPGIHPGGGDNFIHAMPAYVPGLNSAGIKWVSGFPANPEKGLPYIAGLLVLNDVETGMALAVMDCVWITAKRTGAATALSARFLARPDSKTLGILGCGVQGRTNAEGLKVLFPIEKIKAYDLNPKAAEAYAKDMHGALKVEVETVQTPEQAVRGCDIVVTAGLLQSKPHATIKAGWLEAGAFASMVDFDAYWHPEAMQAADKFCTDDAAQFAHYQALGFFKDCPPIHADLGQLFTLQKPGRESEEEITMTANLGMAVEDMAVAPLIYRRAVENGIGHWLPR